MIYDLVLLLAYRMQRVGVSCCGRDGRGPFSGEDDRWPDVGEIRLFLGLLAFISGILLIFSILFATSAFNTDKIHMPLAEPPDIRYGLMLLCRITNPEH